MFGSGLRFAAFTQPEAFAVHLEDVDVVGPRFSTFSEVVVRPNFFLSAPASAPLTVCGLEFKAATILSTVCVLWMSVFGGVAIQQVVQDGYTAAQDAALELQLFTMLEALPFSTITSTVGIILVIVFFVTSSDSGSLVIDTITAGGKVNAPVSQRVFWATSGSGVAIVLLLGGGFGALQAAVISTGLPFKVVLLMICVSLVLGLMSEKKQCMIHRLEQAAD